MPKCRRSRLLLAALAGGVVACAGTGHPAMLGPSREQPAQLVGRWIPESSGSAGSGEVLILRPDGAQWIERRSDSAQGDGPARIGPRAWWWVYRGEKGEPDRLCLHWRAGRHAADCATYALDTVVTEVGTAVRLRWADERFLAAPPPSAAGDARSAR